MPTTTSPIWTLQDATGKTQTLAAWGLRELTRERLNQKPDLLTLRADGLASDANPLFAFGSTVQLFKNGTPWFTGRVVQIPATATARAEDQTYQLAGPWWYLENLVFQQLWQVTNGATNSLFGVNKSRLILGQSPTGIPFTTGQAIAEILNYAIAHGAPLQIGQITPAAIIPYTEILDHTCAEVLRTLLRWTPDAMVNFDYTTTPPTLNILTRATARSVTLPAYNAPTSSLRLTPRYDLQVPAVVLKYDQTNDIGGDTFTTVTVDAAPATATGDEFGAMVMTFDLAGARATYQTVQLTTTPLPVSATDPIAIDWWKTRLPWLTDFADSSLTLTAFSSTVENPAQYPNVSGPRAVPNELLEGSIAAWMNQLAAPILVTATLQYTGPDTPESIAVWGPTKTRDVFTRLTATNANTGPLSRLTSATQAENIPPGLAATIYAAASVLAYDGVLELTEPEISSLVAPGQLLNLSGGRGEWATMNALVQRVIERIDLGQTEIHLGPAHHLKQGDLAAFLRNNSQRHPSLRVNERTTGKSTGNAAKVQSGQNHPRSDSMFKPSASATVPPTPFQINNASTATALQVSINANSFLLQSPVPNNTLAVSGLNTPMAVSAGTLIWLEVDFDANLNPTAASIQSGSAGWSNYPTPFTFTGTAPNQQVQSAFLLLGYLLPASSTLSGTTISAGSGANQVSAKIIQCVTTGLLLQNGAYNGLPVIAPVPYAAPFINA